MQIVFLAASSLASCLRVVRSSWSHHVLHSSPWTLATQAGPSCLTTSRLSSDPLPWWCLTMVSSIIDSCKYKVLAFLLYVSYFFSSFVFLLSWLLLLLTLSYAMFYHYELEQHDFNEHYILSLMKITSWPYFLYTYNVKCSMLDVMSHGKTFQQISATETIKTLNEISTLHFIRFCQVSTL